MKETTDFIFQPPFCLVCDYTTFCTFLCPYYNIFLKETGCFVSNKSATIRLMLIIILLGFPNLLYIISYVKKKICCGTMVIFFIIPCYFSIISILFYYLYILGFHFSFSHILSSLYIFLISLSLIDFYF